MDGDATSCECGALGYVPPPPLRPAAARVRAHCLSAHARGALLLLATLLPCTMASVNAQLNAFLRFSDAKRDLYAAEVEATIRDVQEARYASLPQRRLTARRASCK
ncbi:hypothetical protein EON67_11370 [archaeon]|nr:MAG: hypothetical protein EON67_11370 [archaeon]